MVAIAPSAPVPVPATVARPVARWIQTIDDHGRRRLVMTWQVPDLDEALRAVVDEAC